MDVKEGGVERDRMKEGSSLVFFKAGRRRERDRKSHMDYEFCNYLLYSK